MASRVWQSLKALVRISDIITVHVPHESATERMFNREVFAHVKPGAVFINTSRGELVNERALVDALKKGTLRGAACDVLADEFNPRFSIAKSALWRYARSHNNVILTPHIGGSTIDAWRMTELYVIDKTCALMQRNRQAT